ncbi:MAG: hypothetical protein HQL41_05155 [Alphaproteobacteria bacterium]|nr:hypothetical protein [Alphaproteobacteria bacterium]
MKWLLALYLVVLLSGCAVATVQSYTDPVYRDGPQLKQVVVSAAGMPIHQRLKAEQAMAESIVKAGGGALKASDLLPPTRNFTEAEVAQILKESGADGVVILSLVQQGSESTYVPQTQLPGSSTSYVSVFGNQATVQTYHRPGQTVGGFVVAKPVGAYKATVFEAGTGKTIWMADGSASGNAWANHDLLAITVANEVVAKLIGERIVSGKLPPTTEPPRFK